MTSFDVIARLRKKYGQKKFGHAGTLDPMASGVLVVLAGKACKALQFVSDTDKEYVASIELGASYDTDDVFGTITAQKPVRLDFDFADVLSSFKGKQHQKVPKASAKKVNGKKLYDYLRSAQEVPDVYTDVEIYQIEPVDLESLTFQTKCSSGTYIRSICRDFGEKTGNLAAMKSLMRTRANGFSIDQAEPLECDCHTLYPVSALLDYPKIQAPDVSDVRNGKPLLLDSGADRVCVMDGEELLAVYSKDEKSGLYRSIRGLW